MFGPWLGSPTATWPLRFVPEDVGKLKNHDRLHPHSCYVSILGKTPFNCYKKHWIYHQPAVPWNSTWTVPKNRLGLCENGHVSIWETQIPTDFDHRWYYQSSFSHLSFCVNLIEIFGLKQDTHTHLFLQTVSKKCDSLIGIETSPNYLTIPYSEMTLQLEYPKSLYPESSHLWGQPKSSRKSLKRSKADWGQLRHSPASSNTLRCHQTLFAGKSTNHRCFPN